MTYLQIDPKFHVQADNDGLRIVKTSNMVPVESDEPLFLLRARDYLALTLLAHYRDLCVADGCNDYHMSLLDERIKAFQDFALKNQEKMKQPGITRGL